MTKAEQLHHQATRHLVDLLDYASTDDDPAIATPTARATVAAIAEYTIQLAKERKLQTLKEQPSDQTRQTPAPSP